ncbi:tRNA 2-thiouridine(34) synthase MnmA [Marinisporobacter balticus]|uniref:tRNA-specific 2-thiouridylase MnmA n=1 Tax=Marinisporobacter balticus TaxID=2018667 RepID=A0A4R2L8N9_9FIRM|nr:tRNA 2-thiouridine(34) synthase MnmA [Marinisporobacter balticus]TCO79068.1 tRNA (5-methylaminomethyl-2-thiouridylate)-methyltransferase [Marinisporobacter balticus]
MLLDKKKVVVGMSGGVDSSVAAYVLQKQGYDVIGVTMQVWPEMEESEAEKVGSCCGLSAVDDARRVANKLGIPFYVMNFKDIFEEKVIKKFVEEYISGRTPNPCIACNKFMKFDELLRRARNLGAHYVATGHYAKIVYDEKMDKYRVQKSHAVAKDQTYALYNFTQEQLKHTLMPLGEFSSKEEVRRIASELDFITASKPDSQEICFVKDDDYGKFIQERKPEKIVSGNFVDKNGEILGKHKGISYYTIGQRKGLGIALGKPMYVVDIIPNKNQVVLGENEDVFGIELLAEDINLIYLNKIEKSLKVKAQIRYNANAQDAILYPEGENLLRVVFEQPQRAITPGQAVVFYDEDYLLGGGTITKKVR